jgi:hypothetical protein
MRPIIKKGETLMDDPALRAYLADFSRANDLSDAKESDVFEYFSAYCTFFRDFSDSIILEEAIVAGGLDSGIDAIGMFLNDIWVSSPAQVDEIASRQRLEADFAFVQAKTSRSLSAAEIGSFIQGVKEFFGPRFMPTNESISDRRRLSDHIFSKSVKMRTKPRLHLYYCYTGRYHADPVVEARVNAPPILFWHHFSRSWRAVLPWQADASS